MIHPPLRSAELIAQAWLRSLTEMQGVDIRVGWDAVGSWDGRQALATIDDILSDLPGSFAVQSCVQIDIWSSDRAKELAHGIWLAAKVAKIHRLREPTFVPNQGGRWSLDLEVRVPVVD